MNQFTILFADIAGSTSLYEKLGDAIAETVVNDVLSTLSIIVENQGGKVIKTIGDEIMCLFPSSELAIEAANKMHEYTEFESFHDSKQKISIRVGAHIGTVIHSDGDIYGDTVNVSARIAALARPGKTIISAQTFETLPAEMQSFCRNRTTTYLKGKQEPVDVYDVVWEQNDQLTCIVASPNQTPDINQLTLTYKNQQQVLTANSLKIGRGLECDLIIEATQASRFHCEIRRNSSNKFSLIDTSTNGTYILQNNVELKFHNEMVPLHNSGVLSLGQNAKSNEQHLIHFSIEPA